MFSSSKKVKLNRVSLKDVVKLKIAPRRRRLSKSTDSLRDNSSKKIENNVSELVSEENTALRISIGPQQTRLTQQHGPENGLDVPSASHDHRVENCIGTQRAKKDKGLLLSSNMECKQNQPNTRGKYRDSKHNTKGWNKLSNFNKLGNFRCGFAWCVCAKRAEVQRRGKPSEMSCRKKVPPLVLRKTTKISKYSCYEPVSGYKVSVVSCKPSYSCARGVEVHNSEKAKSARCASQPAASLWARVPKGTPSLPPPNICQNTQPNCNGPAVTDRYLRRSVGASHCVVCGECKYISTQQNKLGKQSLKLSNLEPEAPKAEIKTKRDKGVSQTPEKIIVWINQYPKVTLCDIGKYLGACSHCCSYMLPDALKTNVRCFKNDVKSGFQFSPACFEQEEASLCIPSEDDICEPQSLTEHQVQPNTGSEMPHGEATLDSNHNWTNADGATGSAAFSVGKHTEKGEYRTGICSRDVMEDPEPGSVQIGVDVHRNKRIKLVENGSTSCPAVTDAIEPCEQREVFTGTNRTKMSSESFCETDEENTEDPESFTCQRVKPYVRKTYFSCTRTSMAWPFSCRRLLCTAHAATAVSSAGFTDPIPKDDHSIKEHLHEAESSSNQTKSTFPESQKQKQEGESIVGAAAEERSHVMSANSQRTKMEISVYSMQSEESLNLCSDAISCSVSNGHQREPGLHESPASPLLINGLRTSGSTTTSSPSAFSPSGQETVSPTLDPSAKSASSSLTTTPPTPPPSSFIPHEVKECETVETSQFYCKETLMTSCSSLSSGLPCNSDSFHSCVSSPFLLQDKHKNDEVLLERSPPKLEPCYGMSPFKHKYSLLYNINGEHCLDEFLFPPVLSPVTSPQRQLYRTTLSSPSSSSSKEEEEEEEEMSMDASRNKASAEYLVSWMDNSSNDDSKDQLEENVSTELKTFTGDSPVKRHSSPSSDEDVGGRNKEEGQNESGDDVDQDKRSSEQVPIDPEIKPSHGSGVLTEACSSPSSDEEEKEKEEEQSSVRGGRSSPSETAETESDSTEAGDADASQPGVLDEFTAYEQDILLVEVIQEDPALFENLPEQNLLRLGPARAAETHKKKLPISGGKMSQVELERRLATVAGDFHCGSSHTKEESDSRPWRPRCNANPTKLQNACATNDKQTTHMIESDTNNNYVNSALKRSQPIHTGSSLPNIPPLMGAGFGQWIKNSASVTDFRRQKFNAAYTDLLFERDVSKKPLLLALSLDSVLPNSMVYMQYCRQYFSESQFCGFKNCRFQHLPVEGDEKFCVDTVMRFSKNLSCLQKAASVFTGYYENNPPGVYFSKPMLLFLLWALLKAGMMSDVFSVISVCLTHNIVPSHEFLLDLFSCVREKGVMSLAPELLQLTFKMASVGLELGLDCLDCIKNAPVFQQAAHPNSAVSTSVNQKFSPVVLNPENLHLACAIIEIELCIKQEDWKRMGEVFRSICQSSNHLSKVERISGRIAIALLSESKDKLSLPFAGFAENVCQNESDDSLIKNALGRIGISLILRYHKTHHWAKGCRVVEIMSLLKVSYTTLKSFFGNDDGASRCYLVTVAAELFLLSGSVEGALNTLRENKWFLSSSSWPCEPADLESRTHVLMCLAKKASHRDTLEVLCNLPGIKEANDLVDISRYSPLFNSHLQVCVERNVLPVASDTVDFMLSKKLAIEPSMLQALVHKLGKQNLWLRAREVFRHSLNVGYYSGVSAPTGFMSLIVPCGLREVELALIYEMFVTVNASVILPLPETSTASLSITLRRTQSCESEYLSAGSCLLSAACILQPKLSVHYTTVNSSQEQVFRLDVSSARRWIRHNHLWASEIWAH